MLSSESDDEAAKGKEDMAAMSRKKLLAREAERQNGKGADQVIPKDEEISGGDLSDMEDDEVSASKKTEQAKQNNDDDDTSEKKSRSLKDKRLRSYRGKTGEGADSDEASNLKKDDGKNSRKSKSGTKELPLRYREDDDSSVKRGRHLDRPTSPSSPPPVFDRHQKRYGSSPRRHGRRHSQGSVSPQHHRYRQQDTSKSYRSSGHSYNSWQRSKSPRQQRGHWGSSSPNRGHSPSDKRHQADDDQGSWKNSRYSSQRNRPDNKRKSAGDQDGYEGKKRRTEAGGPRSPSATPPPPPDTEEPRPQQPSEPPPTQPAPPLPSEGSFMPSSKEPTKETVTGMM